MRSLIALVFFTAVAHAQVPDALSLDGKSSAVTYGMVHKLHKFEGTSHSADGKARLLPDGKVQVMVRVPVESFDSGNGNRDAHMKEVVEASRYSSIEVKAAGDVAVPTTFPTTVEKTFKAQISFHGVQQVLDVPVKVIFESAQRIVTDARFAISLDGFKIERPSLMFVKCEDALTINAHLVWKR